MITHRNRLRSQWNRVDSGAIHRAPRVWQPWLSDTGSLTQKIERVIGQKLEVQVLRDCCQTLNSDESRYFHFRIRRCRVREVLW
jgi:chorismate lyase